jgi:peptidoglycan/LPS O-acetylase OafA/YrhL
MPWYLYFTFTQNFWLAHHEWNSTYLAGTWSLAVEEQFYLVLPMIVRVLSRQILLRVAVLLALSSTFVRSLLYLHYGPTWGTAAYTLIFSRADALMVGVICAALLRDPHWKELLTSKRWIAHASCTIFGLGVAVLTYKGWGMGTMPMCTLGFTCLALFYASILMLVTITPIGLMSRAFQARWLMWLGTISYGLYLFHGFAMGVVSRMVQDYPPATADWVRAISTIAAVVASLCFAWLSWGYFESKMVQLAAFSHKQQNN